MPEAMLTEIVSEAQRQDRSLSWIVQHAWRIAKAKIEAMPAEHVLAEPPAHTTADLDSEAQAESPP
jgi:uncharacterized small protein (TIGR04563 family)